MSLKLERGVGDAFEGIKDDSNGALNPTKVTILRVYLNAQEIGVASVVSMYPLKVQSSQMATCEDTLSRGCVASKSHLTPHQ